jgi:hypothetical protein
MKNPKLSPFTHEFRRGTKGKNHLGFVYTSPTKSQGEMSQNHHKKFAKKRL